MTNLVIDIGNTRSKAAVFEGKELIFSTQAIHYSLNAILELINKYHVNQFIIGSVRGSFDIDETNLPLGIKFLRFNHQTATPVKNHYESPETLGLDRLAAVIGAQELFPNTPVLVIDAGTCITFDYIDSEGNYNGGSISPGLLMRLKAMHHFTGKLPLVDFNPNLEDFYGKNTKNAILSGVINGLLFEIKGYIKQYIAQNQDTKIILSGGDSTFFDTKLKNSIFAPQILTEPELVLIGLNTVVNYQHD
jgi:type III pantothenate kinase